MLYGKSCCKIRCIEWGWANRRKGKHKQRKFWSQPSKLDGRAHNSCLYQRRREEKRDEENPRNIKQGIKEMNRPSSEFFWSLLLGGVLITDQIDKNFLYINIQLIFDSCKLRQLKWSHFVVNIVKKKFFFLSKTLIFLWCTAIKTALGWSWKLIGRKWLYRILAFNKTQFTFSLCEGVHGFPFSLYESLNA